jgi:murein DD-endopeptidase MepM/ murein hydrolase activator NlpD
MPLKRPVQPHNSNPLPDTTPKPPPPPLEKLDVGAPEGNTPRLKTGGGGGPWSKVNRDDSFFVKYGALFTVAPEMLKSMQVVETGGEMVWNAGGSGAYGTMQIKKSIWGWVAEKYGYNLQRREGQVATAAAILGKHGQGSDPRERFLQSYYPVRNPDGSICLTCKGEDGATPQMYLDDIARLTDIIKAAAKGTTLPEPVGDVLDLLFGGKPYTITASYGQLVTWQCPAGVPPGAPGNCYEYFAAYGLDDLHHYAIDAAAKAGDGAPIYAPFDGYVVCAGTGIGPGGWGTGCGYFGRLANYNNAKPAGAGAGRLELAHEEGDRTLILGHALDSVVSPGDTFKRGDLVGHQGGMNGSHVHVECRYDGGRKIGDPRRLFGGGPLPDHDYDPVDIPQPDDTPPYVEVRAIRATPVLQRGNPNSPEILPDLAANDTFFAQHKVIGVNGRWYWVGRFKGRVAEEDTEVVRVVQ